MRNLFILITIIVLGIGYWLWLPNADSYQYKTVPISQGKVEKLVVSSGTLSAVTMVEVGSQVSGQITELLVDYNDNVTAGQLVAKLNNSSYLAKVSQLEADVAMANAALGEKQAGVQKAEANLARTLQELKRLQSLLQKKFSSQSDIDTAEANYKVSQAELAVAKSQVVSAKAYIQQKQASLGDARVSLSETEIRSPITGVVLNRLVSEGQTVAASMTTPVLFKIAGDLSIMQIEAFIDEADIAQVKEGQPVRFTVDAWPDKNFIGVISQVRKASTNNSSVVTYTVIISVDNKQQLLLPGMTANTEIITASKENVLRIPNTALRFQPPVKQEKVKAPTKQSLARYDYLQLTQQQTQLIEEELTKQKSKTNNTSINNSTQDRSASKNRMENIMRKVLSAEQLQQYETMQSKRNSSGLERTKATIWTVDDNQQLSPINVFIGMQDDQYTELFNSELKLDDQVVISAEKR
jgi:HlyD family secretion protein